MKTLTIPLPANNEDEIIDIELFVGLDKKKYEFRLESFLWETDDELSKIRDNTSISLARITRLKKSIEEYDKNWDLVQIFAPIENNNRIRVLYRKLRRKK
ncbi:MAG: hypothetical protein JXR51_16245 [Bacteroidales bacterium]|nr:hypothetical protein [Bacteroidales bacterium]MBN2758717.1 hypothetical protein [Bacteroidales bacterium]